MSILKFVFKSNVSEYSTWAVYAQFTEKYRVDVIVLQ